MVKLERIESNTCSGIDSLAISKRRRALRLRGGISVSAARMPLLIAEGHDGHTEWKIPLE